MKKRQITGILLSAVLALSVCMPSGNISVRAAENADSEVIQEAELQEEPARFDAEQTSSTGEAAAMAERAESDMPSEAFTEEAAIEAIGAFEAPEAAGTVEVWPESETGPETGSEAVEGNTAEEPVDVAEAAGTVGVWPESETGPETGSEAVEGNTAEEPADAAEAEGTGEVWPESETGSETGSETESETMEGNTAEEPADGTKAAGTGEVWPESETGPETGSETVEGNTAEEPADVTEAAGTVEVWPESETGPETGSETKSETGSETESETVEGNTAEEPADGTKAAGTGEAWPESETGPETGSETESETVEGNTAEEPADGTKAADHTEIPGTTEAEEEQGDRNEPGEPTDGETETIIEAPEETETVEPDQAMSKAAARWYAYPDGAHRNSDGIYPPDITINLENPPESLTLKVNVQPANQEGLHYSWEDRYGADIGDNADTLTIRPFKNGKYKCFVSDDSDDFNFCIVTFYVNCGNVLTLLPEGSGTVDGVREHDVYVRLKEDVSTTLRTELYGQESENVTYQWYIWYPESAWELLDGETESTLFLPGNNIDTDRFMCRATDVYGNIDEAYFHVSAFINSITSPNGYLQCRGGPNYSINLPINCIGKGSDGKYEYSPITFEAEVDADESLPLEYFGYESDVFTMSGKTATIYEPGEYSYVIEDTLYGINSEIAYIRIYVYDPVALKVYPEDAQIVDGKRQQTVTKTIDPGESVTLSVLSDETDLECSYSWYDPYGNILVDSGRDSSYTFIPEFSGVYKCCVYAADGRDREVYFHVIVDNDMDVLPTGYNTDSDRYDAELNRVTLDLPENGIITLGVDVTARNIGAITYDWRSHDPQDTNLETGWKEIASGSSSSIQVSPKEDTLYECKVTDFYDNSKSAYYLVTVPENIAVNKDLTEAEVSLSCSSYTYTGKTAKPTVTVKYDGVDLTEGKDYILTYSPSNLTSAGTKTVKVSPAEGSLYTGSASATYVIKKAAQTMSAAIAAGSIPVGASSKITVSNIKESAKVTYVSSDTAIASVNSAGTVTAGKVGTAVITVKAASTDNYNAATKQISVTVVKAAQSITASNMSLTYLKTGTITASGYKGKLTYKSLNTAVATVDSTGKVTAKGAGTAKITITAAATSSYNTATKTITVTVVKAAQSITAKAGASSVAVGRTTTVSVTGAKGTKSFKSSDTTIATVTSAGKVTAKKVGTVKITATSAATSNYKAASKTVTIKVVPAATTSLTADNQATGIKLSWKKVTGANGYKIYRGTTLIKTITSAATITFADTKANTNGTKYVYKVVAKASTGDSTLPKSVTVYRVARPALTSVTNSAASKMTVKWGKNAKASGYLIQYSTSKTFASGNKTVTVTGASTVSRVIASLAKGKTYYVRIRTYKTVGSAKYWSTWSASRSVKISK